MKKTDLILEVALNLFNNKEEENPKSSSKIFLCDADQQDEVNESIETLENMKYEGLLTNFSPYIEEITFKSPSDEDPHSDDYLEETINGLFVKADINVLPLSNLLKKHSLFPKYWLRFNKKDRVIWVEDGMHKYRLSKLDLDSINDNFFEYIYFRAREQKEYYNDIKKYLDGHKKTKTIHNILNEMGFKKEIRNIFFPSVSKECLNFQKSITAKELAERNINEKNLRQELEIYKITE